MSVLDMFASALGAFIMCAIILFPYYQDKELKKNIEKTEQAISKAENDLKFAKQKVKEDEQTNLQLQQQLRIVQTSTAALDQCRRDAIACRTSLEKTFLVVSIDWDKSCDVDLYVTDPSGRKYWYGEKRHPGSDAELSYDMKDGPGLEIWQTPVASPGTYEVRYRTIRTIRAAPPKISGVVIDRSGQKQLPVKTLSCGDTEARVASINVSATGSVDVRPVLDGGQ
jgi:hypothetical protein